MILQCFYECYTANCPSSREGLLNMCLPLAYYFGSIRVMIEPRTGAVLVELAASNYGAIPLPEKSYDSITSGKIIAVSDEVSIPPLKEMIGKTGYWRLYKDDCRVEGPNGEKQALIEIKDILGLSDAS